jgi:hypothetical protein
MIERDKCLYFKRGYKYQVTRDYHIKLDIVPFSEDGAFLPNEYAFLSPTGDLKVYAGYAWNGASGPTFDTLNSMIGSLIHDVIYQLIRLGLIDPKYKIYADGLLHALCVEDGMYSWRADYWRWAVLKFGAGSTKPSAEPKEEVAP